MAKKNYTKAGAKRAVNAIQAKGVKLWTDGYITTNEMGKLTDWCKRVHNRIK